LVSNIAHLTGDQRKELRRMNRELEELLDADEPPLVEPDKPGQARKTVAVSDPHGQPCPWGPRQLLEDLRPKPRRNRSRPRKRNLRRLRGNPGRVDREHHRSPAAEQAEEVRKVSGSKPGWFVDPVTIPEAALADARFHAPCFDLWHSRGRVGADGKPAKLLGILTNRDLRFADNPRQPVTDLMTVRW
jgi:hypothetical protein